MKPTFDEWFKEKYGFTFEELHQRDGMWIADSMKKLSHYMREYVSEMVRS
jgi:hypothetical protein